MTEDAPWSGAPGGVEFRDDGIAVATTPSPVVESLGDPNSVVGEALRLLGARVLDLRRQREISSLALTSALPGEGKSTIAMGLAAALAREGGRRILLVEADFRRPSIARTLGLAKAPGLSEWLSGELDCAPVRIVEPGGFFVLVSGQSRLDRPEFLASPRMDALIRSGGAFDFVLLDLAPILPVADTVLIQDLVDGFLVVVRSRLTPLAAVNDALTRLKPDKIMGVVLNDHREYKDSYRSYAYRRYGMVHVEESSSDPSAT